MSACEQMAKSELFYGQTSRNFQYTVKPEWGMNIHGPDGVFLTADGKCVLIESKACDAGSLGISGKSINPLTGKKHHLVQGDPGWFKRAMYRHIKEHDDYTAIINSVGDQPIKDVLIGVKYVKDHIDELVEELASELDPLDPKYLAKRADLKRCIENFADPKLTERIFRTKLGTEFAGKIGTFFDQKFLVGIVNRKGWNPGRLIELKNSTDNFFKAFGKNIKKGADILVRKAK